VRLLEQLEGFILNAFAILSRFCTPIFFSPLSIDLYKLCVNLHQKEMSYMAEINKRLVQAYGSIVNQRD